MSQLNPYDRFLKGQDPITVLSATPDRLAAIKETLKPADIEASPAPGKWSVKEILSHLADCELVFGFRLRQTFAQDHAVIQPFDQDDWAKNYAAYNADVALAAFSAARAWNLALIRSAKPADLAREVTHPERGTMTFQTIVETMGGHDINHLGQLDALAAKFATAR